MKKGFSFCLLSLFILELSVMPAFSQNAKEILDKVIEAQGGRKLLESIKDVTTTADMELIEMGMSGSGTMYTKEPNMMRFDMEFMGIIVTQAFDGEKAWGIDPQSGISDYMPEEYTKVMKHSAYGNAAFLDPEKYGIQYKYKGKENVGGKDYLVLDRIHPDGYTITQYIDPETYLILRMKQESFDEMMTEIVEETILSDYKEVEGLMMAHEITIIRDGLEFATITTTGIEFNTGLEDSFFKKEE
jgi:outer membrane lipoprotein-sorting protein